MLHADETSWRVAGKTHWLWAFANDDVIYYMIDRSRGEPALRKFFVEEFQGTLVTDFWGAYNAVVCAARQGCLVHLLRDLHTVEHYKKGGAQWPEFAKKLRRLVGDAIRLWRATDLSSESRQSRRQRLDERLDELIATAWDDTQATAADQAFAAASRRPVHVPRQAGRPLRQQSCRAGGSSGGDHSQEQLRQPKPTRRRGSGGLDEHLSHAQTTRS